MRLKWKPTWGLNKTLQSIIEWHQSWLNGEDMRCVTLSQINNHENKLKDIPVVEEKDESNPLFDKSIIITGFRNKELSEELKEIGANESSAVSKNTFAVIQKKKSQPL